MGSRDYRSISELNIPCLVAPFLPGGRHTSSGGEVPWAEVSWRTVWRRQHVTWRCPFSLTYTAAHGGHCPQKLLLKTSFCMKGTSFAHSQGTTHICRKNNSLVTMRVCSEGKKQEGPSPRWAHLGCSLFLSLLSSESPSSP